MRWIKRITKWISVTVAVLFSLVVAAYIGLLIVNRSDEQPSTAATAFAEMVNKSPSPDSNDNAMLYFVGIDAPRGADPLVKGQAWLKWSRLPVKKQWKTDEPQGEDLYSYLNNDACITPTSKCLSALQHQHTTHSENLNKTQWILDRYEHLLHYTKWHDINADSALTILNYSNAMTLSRLYSLQVWRLKQNGKTKQALEALDREARFWRMVLADSRTIIGKMVANGLLLNNLKWTNAVLRQAPADLRSAVPDSWQKTVTLQERSFQQAFANELLLAKNIIEQRDELADDIPVMDRVGNALAAPLIKIQAMLNLIASDYDRVNQALDVPYSELPDSLNALRQLQEKESHQGMYHAYNPIGYILYRIGNSAYLIGYGLRIADLEGKRRVLILAASVRDKGVAPAEVPTQLSRSDIRNPYTGEAFGWDKKTKSITFRGLESQGEKVFQLPY